MGEGFPTREQIRDRQLAQLRELLARLVPDNRFYTPRIRDAGLTTPPASLEEFSARMPYTVKAELARDQEAHPPYGTNLTQPLTDYTRLHQTSSTTGKPLRWLDTPQSWRWMVAGWEEVLQAAEVTSEDRVLVAFAFGPFLGLWLGFEAAEALGALTIPGGAMNSEARLRVILSARGGRGGQ